MVFGRQVLVIGYVDYAADPLDLLFRDSDPHLLAAGRLRMVVELRGHWLLRPAGWLMPAPIVKSSLALKRS